MYAETRVPLGDILNDKNASPPVAIGELDCKLFHVASSLALTLPRYKLRIVGSTELDVLEGLDIVILGREKLFGFILTFGACLLGKVWGGEGVLKLCFF